MWFLGREQPGIIASDFRHYASLAIWAEVTRQVDMFSGSEFVDEMDGSKAECT